MINFFFIEEEKKKEEPLATSQKALSYSEKMRLKMTN